jgi:hypothetical protein
MEALEAPDVETFTAERPCYYSMDNVAPCNRKLGADEQRASEALAALDYVHTFLRKVI